MADEEKEQKPKKMFTVIHTCWDDGEIDTEMYEFRKNQSGRGAPGKWRLNGQDFNKRVEELLGDPDGILEEMSANTHLGSIPSSTATPIVSSQPPSKVKVKKQSTMDDITDVDFEDHK